MNADNQTPYANLNPDTILNAVESAGYHCNGSLFALNSYENRVYQVGIENDAPLIVKFYRPGRWSDEAILEEHAFSEELFQHEIPVIAPLSQNAKTLHHFNEFRFAVFPRQGGRGIELDDLDNLERMGRFIGRLHAVGACKPFKYRLHLTPQTYGDDSLTFLLKNNFFPPSLLPSLKQTVESLLEKIKIIFSQVGEIKLLRLHGDCHAGNILWNDNGPRVVDLDDCLMGPAIQDIWMLLSGNTPDEINAQLYTIIAGYEDFYPFDYREIHLIEVLRTLRLLQYCAWLAKRWNDPAFPRNFPWFNTHSYWQTFLADLREQEMLLDKLL